MKINSKMFLKWPSKKAECHLFVKEILKDDDIKWVYTLECYDGVPKMPKQEITFTIIKIDSNMCFLEFKHTFLEYIKHNVIQNISKDKILILKTLKEKLIEKNLNRENQKY